MIGLHGWAQPNQTEQLNRICRQNHRRYVLHPFIRRAVVQHWSIFSVIGVCFSVARNARHTPTTIIWILSMIDHALAIYHP